MTTLSALAAVARLTTAAILLMSTTSCASRGTLRPARTGCSAGIFNSLDHDPEDREAHALNIGRLRANERRHGLDGGGGACACFSAGRTCLSTNFATFAVSLAATVRASLK